MSKQDQNISIVESENLHTEKLLNEDKSRTPSGNIIVNKASDIRNFFSPPENSQSSEEVLSAKKASLNSTHTPKRKRSSETSPINTRSRSRRKQQDKHVLASKIRHASIASRHHKNNPFKALAQKINRESSADESFEDLEDGYFTPLGTSPARKLASTATSKMENQLNMESPAESSSVSNVLNQIEGAFANGVHGPETMSVRTVLEMFGTLKQEMIKMNDKIQTMTPAKDIEIPEELKEQCKDAALQCFADDLQEGSNKVEKLQKDLKAAEMKNRILTEVVQQYDVRMSEIENRLNNLEINNTKKMVILTGLYASEDKKELIQQVKDFLGDNLGLSVPVEDAFQIGSYDPKPIVIVLQSMEDKRMIMEYKSLLNRVTNQDNQKFYINDYYPAPTQEKRKRERAIYSVNKALDDEDENKMDMKFTKAGLRIQGEIYFKRVRAPTPKELIETSLDDYDAMMSVKMEHGRIIERQNSKFLAYTKSVDTHYEIRQLYKKMKLQHPGAQHIVCVYSIPGEEKHYTNDYWDDDEHGAGKNVLEWMRKHQLDCRVFFIVRYYGQSKLGADRFTYYREACRTALEANSYNYHLNIHQKLKSPRSPTGLYQPETQQQTSPSALAPKSLIPQELIDASKKLQQEIDNTSGHELSHPTSNPATSVYTAKKYNYHPSLSKQRGNFAPHRGQRGPNSYYNRGNRFNRGTRGRGTDTVRGARTYAAKLMNNAETERSYQFSKPMEITT